MKCIGGVISIPRAGSEGFEKCSKRIIGIIRKKSRTQLRFTSRESGGTWQELCKGVTLGRPWLLPGAVGLRMGLDAAGCPPGQGAGHQLVRWFKGKTTLGAVISFGGFNCVSGHEAEVLLLEKTSVACPQWDAETRGAGAWDSAQALLELFPSFPPALESSTLLILN